MYAARHTPVALLLLSVYLYGHAENWIYRYDGPDMLGDMPYASAYGFDNSIYVTGYSQCLATQTDFIVLSLTHEGDTNWTYRYNDPVDGGDIAYAITCSADSHVYVAGMCRTDSSYYDLAVVRLTVDGLEDWVFQYDGPAHGPDKANAITCGVEGNIYVAGESMGRDGHMGLVVIRLAPSGNVDWVYCNDRAKPYDVICGADSNVYLAGYCMDVLNNINFSVISMKSSGEVNWIYQYNGPDNLNDMAFAIDCGMDGNIYAAGVSYHFGVNGYPVPDVMVVGLTPTGQELWTYRHNGHYNGNDVARDITFGADSTIYVAGASHAAHYKRDFIVVSLSTTGIENWLYRFGTPGYHDGEAQAIAYDTLSNSICATGYSSNDHKGGLTVVNLNQSGDTNWTYIYDGETGNSTTYGRALEVGADGDFYVSGFDLSGNRGPDIVVISLAATSGIHTHNNVSPSQLVQLSISPNPFSTGAGTRLQYTLPVNNHVEIAIYNALGQRIRSLVNTIQPQGSHSIMWYGDDDTGRHVAQGTYFCRLTAGDFSTTEKILFLK